MGGEYGRNAHSIRRTHQRTGKSAPQAQPFFAGDGEERLPLTSMRSIEGGGEKSSTMMFSVALLKE